MVSKGPSKNASKLSVETLNHAEATRKNIPTAEYQSVMRKEEQSSVRVAYERRNRDLDPQLVWRGKDEQDWSDLVVHAPPLYIQEKVHPKVLIDDLLRTTETGKTDDPDQIDMFADFNGLPDENAKTEFYQHDSHWANRMILGDSLQVMASLAEREGLRGKVQCIYLDPPYGIKFNSNFQWSTTSRDVTDGKTEHITREPEQVKAFRDTWRDGIHSYLTYLRDRLTVARDLLTDSGSIFLQIGDENLSRVKELLNEVFGEENVVITIPFQKKAYQEALSLAPVNDYIVWAAKSRTALKFRPLYVPTPFDGDIGKYTRIESPNLVIEKANEKEPKILESLIAQGWRLLREDYPVVSQDPPKEPQPFMFQGVIYEPTPGRHWSQRWPDGMQRLSIAGRLRGTGSRLYAREYWTDSAIVPRNNLWVKLKGPANPNYVVETATEVVKRCILMATDPGDLVLDPTCGSGTSAYVAEQWGRRWITIDTSRVALALARARIMSARYPYYLLTDSHEGQLKEAEISRSIPSSVSTRGDIRQGFVYERVPHITLKAIANNAEIEVIWDKFQEKLEPLCELLNVEMGRTLGKKDKEPWKEWEVPYEAEYPWDIPTQKFFYGLKNEQACEENANPGKLEKFLCSINHNLKRDYTLKTLPERPADIWPEPAQKLHAAWWKQRIARQKEIDASIAAKAEFEYLYDKPYSDKKKIRVAGPFTVESVSPHRVLVMDENDELIDKLTGKQGVYTEERDFVQMILENLKTAGVQQAHKEDKIAFTALTPWPGDLICAEGRYIEGHEDSGTEKRAAIFIGPEFGTVSRLDLVTAAREAGDSGFDVLITCAFNYDAHSAEFDKLGRIPVLKARMNADLHMAEDLKNTGKGNLFVIFGEPDIDVLEAEGDKIRIKVNGVDVFHPNTGEVRSDGAEGIACWFIDTDYNEESFFVRHAYFLGANDPYKALKTTLKAEINEEAWASLNSDTSRPFEKPKSGRIAVKVINHLGDEVMKVFRVE